MLHRSRVALGLTAFFVAACAASEPAPAPPPPAPPAAPPPIPADEKPIGQLPRDVRPVHYTLVLDVQPDTDRFAGTVEIAANLDKPRSVIWMHGKNLHVKGASVRPEGGGLVAATLDDGDAAGVAALKTSVPVGPGRVTIHIDYDAPFSTTYEGLHKVKQRGRSYAFTQFESVYARQAFPSFDEPGFKTPFDVTIFAPKGAGVVANAHEVERRDATAGLERVTFATTEPLPTYLVAFAVGPLDIVKGPPVPPNAARQTPLPLGGVAANGRGKDMAFAMAHTGEVLTALEKYFGVAYPYDKLDILAVPEKAGAMENPGAVTFREWLVMLDEHNASLDQQRAFYGVMSHELAHQWFGDLVTMKWWDDTWLNEAFATWMSNKITHQMHPELHQDVSELTRVQQAMGVDSLVSARQIRQPVRDNDDIYNSFDAITYVKGGSVLAMFERFVGAGTFQKGIASYLAAHRFGNATADDLLKSLSEAAKRDVATPFKTFLEQPGVPLVQTYLSCAAGAPKLHVKQSRYLPLGSGGDPNKTWQIPMCVLSPVGKDVKETCALVTDKEADIALPGATCPKWVQPNADGAGYYRFTLPAEVSKHLAVEGLGKLGARDRMTFAMSVKTGFSRGTTSTADALAALAPLVKDPSRSVAMQATDILDVASFWFDKDPEILAHLRARGAAMYLPVYKTLGWTPKKGDAHEGPEKQLLRQSVIRFLALEAHEPGVRKEAAALGRAFVGYGTDGAIHEAAVDPNLAGIALAVAVQEGDAAFFDALASRLEKTDDETLRVQLLSALSLALKPELAKKALALSLDPHLRGNEWMAPIEGQLGEPETREAAWTFVREHLDALLARGKRASILRVGQAFCDKAHQTSFQELFAPHLKELEGAPRAMAETLESISLCMARRAAQEPGARAFFSKK